MKPELLHEALNLLDDKMLEEVQQYRRGRGRRLWHLSALAACLAVVCALSFLVPRSGGREVGAALPEQGTAAVDIEALESAGESELTDNCALEAEAVRGMALLVEVTALEADRLQVRVLADGQGYRAGQRLTVLLCDETVFRTEEDEWLLSPEQLPFEVGACLSMRYRAGADRDTVYALSLAFAE